MAARRPMTPEDIRRIVVVEELDLSADGRTAIVVRRSIESNRYVGHLFAIDLGSKRSIPAPRQLTRGTIRDTKPRLCPDGHTLAFVRTDPTDDDSVAAIQLLDLRRASSVHAAKVGHHGAVGELAWSPDGHRLAFTAEVDPPRFIAGPTRPIWRRRKSGADDTPLARRITRTDWRWDEEGHRDRWSHLFVIDLPTGRPRRITSGDWGVSDISWFPDSRTIAFTSDRTADPDTHPRTTIWAVDVDAATGDRHAVPREVLAPAGWATHASVSPDGRWIAATGMLQPDPIDDVSPSVMLGPTDGSKAPWLLAPELDRPVGQWIDADLTGWFVYGRHGPVWADEASVVATISDRGRSHPYVFVIDGATGSLVDRSPAVTGDVVTHTLAVARRDDERPPSIAFLGTDGARAMELYTDDAPTANRCRRRSSLGSRWQDALQMPEMRLVVAPGTAVRSTSGSPHRPAPAVAGSPRSSTSTVGRSGRGDRRRTSKSCCSRRTAIASSCPTSGVRPRTAATGSDPSWVTGAGSMPPMSTPQWTTSSRWASSTPTGSA